MLRITVIVLIVIVVGIQFYPTNMTNPPVTGEIKAPPEVMEILRTSCYDCHSNETVWPWYSRVAPVSIMVDHDVNEGRENMNFSEWQSYTDEEKLDHKEEIWEEIEEGEMPEWKYVIMHKQAELAEDQKETIRTWSESAELN